MDAAAVLATTGKPMPRFFSGWFRIKENLILYTIGCLNVLIGQWKAEIILQQVDGSFRGISNCLKTSGEANKMHPRYSPLQTNQFPYFVLVDSELKKIKLSMQ